MKVSGVYTADIWFLMLCELCFQNFWHLKYWFEVFLSGYSQTTHTNKSRKQSYSARFRWQFWVQGMTNWMSLQIVSSTLCAIFRFLQWHLHAVYTIMASSYVSYSEFPCYLQRDFLSPSCSLHDLSQRSSYVFDIEFPCYLQRDFLSPLVLIYMLFTWFVPAIYMKFTRRNTVNFFRIFPCHLHVFFRYKSTKGSCKFQFPINLQNQLNM